jgi:uncharacterized protein (DUF1499 family)
MADFRILFLRVRNFAELDEPGSPELANVVLPLAPDAALAHIRETVARMPLWRVESADAKSVHLTRTTRLFRFTDDIRLSLEPAAGGTRLRGRSQSRVGLSDFGQNHRNLRALIRALTPGERR